MHFKLFFFLLFSLVTALSAYSDSHDVYSYNISTGTTLDVAPFGIEKVYITAQVSLLFPGNPSLALKSIFSYHEDSMMFRVPIVLSIALFTDKLDFTHIFWYAGSGGEIYHFTEHTEVSPLLTSGLSFVFGCIYTDINVTSAYRSNNTDSDIAMSVGLFL